MSERDSAARQELDDETIQQLERLVFSARNYVVPSSDLRPRVLEQARDACRTHVWTNRLAVTALAAMLFWGLALAAMRTLGEYRNSLTGPFPEEIEQRAESLPRENPYETPWRTLDAFQQERCLPIRGRDSRTDSKSTLDSRISHF